ncbi:MAG: stage 0 sporulation family protein [Novipirellula sp. JB048]
MSDAPHQTATANAEPSERLEYVVRCGSMRILGVMTAKQTFRYGDQVVVRTTRGTEIGTVLCEATPAAVDHLEEPTAGAIVRALTADDQNQWKHLESKMHEDIAACQKLASRLNLQMDVVDVERILGGERMVVYYLAEHRVDFRQLVRDLASHFQTRIEMRQIGVRDEAKLLADYGDCGQPICCANHLSKMPPVSMRMAKLQKATLDPSKISGRCGRLKCCLRYEFDTYEALAAELPPVGSQILTRDGSALVLGQDILSQQLAIKTEDGRRIMLAGADVISITKRGTNEKRSHGKRKKKKR